MEEDGRKQQDVKSTPVIFPRLCESSAVRAFALLMALLWILPFFAQIRNVDSAVRSAMSPRVETPIEVEVSRGLGIGAFKFTQSGIRITRKPGGEIRVNWIDSDSTPVLPSHVVLPLLPALLILFALALEPLMKAHWHLVRDALVGVATGTAICLGGLCLLSLV